MQAHSLGTCSYAIVLVQCMHCMYNVFTISCLWCSDSCWLCCDIDRITLAIRRSLVPQPSVYDLHSNKLRNWFFSVIFLFVRLWLSFVVARTDYAMCVCVCVRFWVRSSVHTWWIPNRHETNTHGFVCMLLLLSCAFERSDMVVSGVCGGVWLVSWFAGLAVDRERKKESVRNMSE